MPLASSDPTIPAFLSALTQFIGDGLGVQGGSYHRLSDGDDLPVFSLEIEWLEPSEDQPGGDQAAVDVDVVLVIAFDPVVDDARIGLAALGATSVRLLHNKMGLVPGRALRIDVERGGLEDLLPGFETYLTWATRFRVCLIIGDDEPVGVTPQNLKFSYAPKVGTDHLDDYQPI